MTDDIKVLVADDHDHLRNGLASFLDSCDGISVIGTASTGKEAVERCADLQPDVVLMDIHMPGMDGIAATRLIRADNPAIQVVILTNDFDDSQWDEAMSAGASRFLFKAVTVDGIANAIRAAHAGHKHSR